MNNPDPRNWFPKRSDFVQAIMDFKKLCKADGRDFEDELQEAIDEATT